MYNRGATSSVRAEDRGDAPRGQAPTSPSLARGLRHLEQAPLGGQPTQRRRRRWRGSPQPLRRFPSGVSWGSSPLSGYNSTQSVTRGEDGSSVSRPGGTPGWLLNFRPGSAGHRHHLGRTTPIDPSIQVARDAWTAIGTIAGPRGSPTSGAHAATAKPDSTLSAARSGPSIPQPE